mgnify:CR=1 FL=1
MEIAELVKLAAGAGTGLVIAIMVLKFMFKIVENKFNVDSQIIQKNYTKNVEIGNCVSRIAKTIDKVSESQLKIVTLIDSVNKRINSYNKK